LGPAASTASNRSSLHLRVTNWTAGLKIHINGGPSASANARKRQS
jgi:DUF1680 family protein